MRIGVLGGTFDPIHNGHLIIAQEALKALDLFTVIFVPAASPPHKPGELAAPIEHRYRMVELALEGESRFSISGIERRRGGRSYTVDTLEEMTRSLGPDDELCFLVGSDTVSELPTWKEVGRLPELCRLIVIARPGYPLQEIDSLVAIFSTDTVQQIRRDALLINPVSISATAIRQDVAQGRSIGDLVPEPVRCYIKTHGLYRRPAGSSASSAPSN